MKRHKPSLLFFIYIPLAISFFMLFLYFLKFYGSLSDLSDDWGNFGAYFGSVTGLMAFLAIIYTHHKSEERFKKLDDLNTKREDRDLYFKLITLQNKNLFSLTYSDGSNTYSGSDSINKYFVEFNKLLLINSIIEVTKHVTEENWFKYIENKEVRDNADLIYLTTLRNIYYLIDKEFNGDWRMIYRNKFPDFYNNESEILELVKINQDYSIFSTTIFEKFDVELSKSIVSNLLTKTMNFFHKKYGRFFDQYIDGINYIVNTCAEFHKDHRDYFNRHFNTQLSRIEVLFVFLFNMNDKRNTENLIYSGILNSVEINDIYIFKNISIEKKNEYITNIVNADII